MKSFYFTIFITLVFSGCANNYPTNYVPAKTTHVEEEKPQKYDHPPEDLRSVVEH